MERFGYYDKGLFYQHEAEVKSRNKLQSEVLEKWKLSAKNIQNENETMLQKEARREAVIRIEDAARTMDEYQKVTILWDCLEIIEGWRLAKAEPKRTELLTESEFYRSENIIPSPIHHEWWRQILSGSFLDAIHDCPHEIQELTSSRPVFFLVKKLDEKQKEVFYYLIIRQWTPQKLATMRKQTDRNIRKIYAHMIENFREKLFHRLYPRYEMYWNLTTSQIAFVERYIEKHSGGEIRAELPEEIKTMLRRLEHEQPISKNKRILGEILRLRIQAGE